MKARADIQKYLERTMEGGLYVDINMTHIGGTFIFAKDWYAVIDGMVYDVSNGVCHPTGDELFDLKNDCKRVGRYKPEQKHKRIVKSLEYSELKKIIKL